MSDESDFDDVHAMEEEIYICQECHLATNASEYSGECENCNSTDPADKYRFVREP